jgi:HEPN domain-containing protein
MKKIVSEWLEKALADAGTAEREAKVQQDPNWDAVCFHAQQAVEKLLKALLQQQDVVFPKTHDLGDLLERLLLTFPQLTTLKDSLEWLTTFAIQVRYPGENALEEDAHRCLTIMREAIQDIKPILKAIEPQ